MRLILSLFILLISQAISAQDIPRLNALLDKWEKGNRYMGEVLIAKGADPVVHRYLGYRNIEKNTLHDSTSIFPISSISKTFTAILVLKAVEADRINLDGTVDLYLPDLPNGDKMTIRHLLQHRTGLKSNMEDAMVRRLIPVGAPLITLIKPLYNMEPNFSPGEEFEYSVSNYLILSYILEVTYGQNYQTILDEQITKPMGLDNTFLTSLETDKLMSKSSGHYRYQKAIILSPSVHPLFSSGARGINSTARDIFRLSNALFKEELLPLSLWEQMKATAKEETYGMGIFKTNVLNKEAIGHNGSIDGFHATWFYFPGEDVTMILLMNRETFSFERMIQELVAAYFDMSIPPASYMVDKSTVDKISGTYAISPRLKISIYQDEDVLLSRATGEEENVLIPTGELQFMVSGMDSKIIFGTENGVVTHLVWEQEDLIQRGNKEAPIKID